MSQYQRPRRAYRLKRVDWGWHGSSYEITLWIMRNLSSHFSMKTSALALLAVFCLGLSPQAFAQWKWRDKNDRVQYSDLPPPGDVPESAILQKPAEGSRRALPTAAPAPASGASGAAPASGPGKTVDPELEAKRKKAEQEEAAKRKVEEDKNTAAKQENCNRAKAQIRGLDEGIRIARVNTQGEREILDDKGRAEEAKRARDIMSSDCPK
jgi:type IV secretory pathway VirB10-like protein